MNAFDDGRVGCWVNSAANLSVIGANKQTRLQNIAAFADGMFSDVFLPYTSDESALQKVWNQKRPNGAMLRAQSYADPHDMTAPEFATAVFNAIVRTGTGVMELDIEPNSTNRVEATGAYANYMATLIPLLRSKATWMAHFPLRLNIPPYKGEHLPDAVISDPYLYACEQTYYGDMGRVSEGEALLDLLNRGVPKEKAALCYGVVAPDKDLVRRLTLPTVFYKGQVVRKLKRGLVFTDDLMADQGLL